jgi:hypothetical protein
MAARTPAAAAAQGKGGEEEEDLVDTMIEE